MPIEYLLRTQFTLGEAASATLVDLLHTLGELFPASPTLGDGVLDCDSNKVVVASSIIGVKFFNVFIALFADVPGSNSIIGVSFCNSFVRFSSAADSLSIQVLFGN